MIKTMTSDEARREWRLMLDEAYIKGQHVVIERWSQPVAVVVNYEQYQQMRQAWLEWLDRLSAEAWADNVAFEQIEEALAEAA
jgi:PHD/YefM family antitoxin component YafN of YafNO toxin-antitoxin module